MLTGPTASGKSNLAFSIAETLAKQNINSVIINADSQQVVAELRILTARPSPEEEARIPHKLYGFMPAAQACSAGKWLNFARMEIDWARSQGMQPIVVGGTGLYIKALMQGIAEIPDIDPAVRAQATSDFEQMGKESFAERLKHVDPEFFERLKVYDRQRLIRAYEVWLGSGKSLSWWQKQGATVPYPAEVLHLFKLEIDREELYRRCDARFIAMVEQGAPDEVKQLLDLQLSPDLPAMKSVGVPELAAYLRGEMTLEAAIEKAQQATRNYAKRQLTWLRNQFDGHFAGDGDAVQGMVKKIH